MPAISMFYGIIIRMFYDEHQPPHFHAIYQGIESLYTLDGEHLHGKLPKRQQRFVEAWAELHFDELLADWELAKNGETPFIIDPLRM